MYRTNTIPFPLVCHCLDENDCLIYTTKWWHQINGGYFTREIICMNSDTCFPMWPGGSGGVWSFNIKTCLSTPLLHYVMKSPAERGSKVEQHHTKPHAVCNAITPFSVHRAVLCKEYWFEDKLLYSYLMDGLYNFVWYVAV